jgi:hypothetical protein
MFPMPSDSNLKRLRIIAFSLVMVLVPFIVYYYFYVSNQTKYFTGRDLRILAALGRHVEGSVESQGEVFKNAVGRFLVDLQATVDEEDDDDKLGDKRSVHDRLKEDPGSFKERFQTKSLDPLKGDSTNLTITNLEVVSEATNPSTSTSPRIEIRQEENQRWLYFDYTSVYPVTSNTPVSNFEDLSTEGKGPPPIFLNFKVRTNLADLVGQFVNSRRIEGNDGSDEGDGFDAILLAEIGDNVDVVFLASSARMRIASLDNLTSVPDGAKIDLKQLGQSTNMADVKVGPGDYKLFFQPIKLPLARLGSDKQQDINLLACGFVDSGRFRRESWSVSYTVLILFGFLAVLVALSWPFLKLLLIGPKDRFRPIDTYLLIVSAILITALLTFFGSFVHGYMRAERLLDDELGAFAGTIQDNFNNELRSALKEIDSLNCHKLLERSGFHRPAYCKEDQSERSQIPTPSVTQRNLFRRLQQSKKDTDRRRILLEDQLADYPYFISAFWADNLGNQRIKWTVRQSLTNNVPVASREYFYKLRQGQPYKYLDDEGKERPFYLQPIVSRTTGQNEVIISKPIFPFVATPNQMWISAISTRLLSLMDPVVPSGFGFAVIDDSGKVLFHSDEKKHLGENLFEESDNNQALRAAVLGRSQQLLNASYLGKGHSMYVRPMGHFGWTIVVFRNKDILRTTFSEILTLCLVLFFTYQLFMLILTMGIYLVNRTSADRATWLWPAPDKTKVYVSLLVINILLLLLSVASVRWFPGFWKIAVPVGTAFAAVLLFVLVLKRTKESQLSTKLMDRLTKRSPLNHRTVYTFNATLLFVLISVIPAYACFKLSYAEELKLFIKEGQLKLARSMANREDRLRTQYSWASFGRNREAMEEFLTKRLKDTSYDVYNKFFFQTTLNEAPPLHEVGLAPSDNNLIRFFKNFVPLFNQSSVDRHALMWPAADQSWEWEEPSANELALHVEGALTATQQKTPRLITSVLPRLNGSSWWLIWPILLTVVALLVSYMLRQIFLFKHDETSDNELSDFCADSISHSLFLVLNPPFIGKRQLLRRLGLDKRELERIDVGESGAVEKWVQECQAKEGKELSEATNSNGHPVIIDNFDFASENFNQNQERLSLLEKLHDSKRVAIAVSTFDTDRFMHTNGNSEAGTEPDKEVTRYITERWTGVVSHFFKVTLEDFGDPEGFKNGLRERKRQVLADEKLNPEARKQIKSVFEMIVRECSPRACLQSIGENIAKQRNLGKQKPSSIPRQVLVQAMPYYKSIWRVCSDDEKLTLSHLAQDGLLSASDSDIEGLMKRGLIIREPAIRLMNESFKSFVIGVGGAGKALAHCEEKARKSSNWEVLKVPLTIGLVSVLGFLLLTQREIYNSALPIITAITAGVPSFFKLISLFHGGSGGKASG